VKPVLAATAVATPDAFWDWTVTLNGAPATGLAGLIAVTASFVATAATVMVPAAFAFASGVPVQPLDGYWVKVKLKAPVVEAAVVPRTTEVLHVPIKPVL